MPESVVSAVALMMALMPSAEASVCRPPATISTPHAEHAKNEADIRRLPIGGYTLALSWSPEFCMGQRSSAGFQCHGGHRFGLILHGLWPDGKGASWPQWCRPAAIVPRDVLRENLCTMPGEQLMQHEWAKHGSCMAKTPKAYFDRARGLYQRLRFPDMNGLAGRYRVTAGDVAGAFARANPGMAIDMLRVQATRTGTFSEIHICLDTAFKPTRCRADKRGLNRNARIRIRPNL